MRHELRPLLGGSLEPELQEVLESAQGDGPSPEQVKSAALALGLPATIAGSVAAATAVGVAKTGAGGAKTAISLLLAKWFGSGILLGLVTATGASYLAESSVAPDPAATLTPTTSMAAVAPKSPTAPPAQASAHPAPVQPAAPPGSHGILRPPLPHEPSAREGVAAPEPSVASFETRAQKLRAETAVLDEARRALKQGRAAAVLAVLARYDRTFPQRLLAPEAEVLRARALIRAGRAEEARALVARATAKRPNDVHALRLLRLVGLPPPKRRHVQTRQPASSPAPPSSTRGSPPTASF